MEQNILISKIAASPTETGWAQAYSTHYLYFVMSIKQEAGEHEIATLGKELLEKLQREFFSLPDKKLNEIKTAVSASIENIPEGIDYSIVVATIIGEVLYIVTAGQGQVIIKRGEHYTTIAHGEQDQIYGFSGKIKHTDIIILETHDFSEKISKESIKAIPHVTGVLDLSENIAPLLHQGAFGTEAAIFLQYQNFSQVHSQFAKPQEEPQTQPKTQSEYVHPVDDPPVPKYKRRFSLSMPRVTFNKRILIGFIIVLLAAVLLYQLTQEKQQRAEDTANQALLEVLKPAQAKYQEGLELMSLNESLALDDFRQAHQMLKSRDDQFPPNTEARAQYDSLFRQIESKLKEFEEGALISNPEVLFDPQKSSEMKAVASVTTKGGDLAIIDNQGTGALLENGDIENTYTIDSSLKNLTGNEQVLMVLGTDGVYQIDKKGSSGKKIISESNLTAVDMYGTNIYTSDGQTIAKYGGEGFSKSSYFTNKPIFETGISDFSIDGAVWIIEKNGAIHKFLKGAKEPFTVKNLPVAIGKNPKLYTSEALKDLYVLDVAQKKVLVIGKDGDYKISYSLPTLSPTSLAVDEAAKKGYVVSGNKLYSFDIQ